MFSTTDREVWEQELKEFVPDRVFDSHVHLWRAEDVPEDLELYPSDVGLHSFGGYTVGQFKDSMARLLPGRSVSALIMGMPKKGIPREAMNRYVGEVQRAEPGMFGLAIVAPQDPMEDVQRWIETYGLLGYKLYDSLVAGKQRSEVTLRDMLSPEQLDYANQRGLLVLLHIPRRHRLAEPVNKAQIRELAVGYPNITWIIAHVGRAYFLAALVGHIEEVCDLPNVYFDLAFVNLWEVMVHAIRTAGVEKFLFGTDMPVAELKGKNVDFNNQRLYVTERPFPWSVSNPALKLNFTRFYYEELRGLKKAARELRLTDGQIEDIFFCNAARLIAVARARGA